MPSRNSLIIAKTLAFSGFAFWIYYIVTYILGMPMFLNTPGEDRFATQVGFGVYGYAVLLVGVTLGAIYQELKVAKADGNKQVEIGQMLRRATRTVDFWLGIFASPVVYAVLLQAVDMTNVTISSFVGMTLVGLQNGFVCNTVAETLISKGPPSPTSPAKDGGT